jgi:hypothetical protein
MNDVAHISFKGGGLIVPVETPYERELLFEHVEVYTKRHRSVRLEVDRRQWTISRPNGRRELCASCRRWLDSSTYRLDGQPLCGQCARRIVQPERTRYPDELLRHADGAVSGSTDGSREGQPC